MNKIKVAAISPQVFVGDPIANARMIITESKEAAFEGASIVVFPELSLTGCSIGDLAYQFTLQDAVCDAIDLIKKETEKLDAVITFGYLKDDEAFGLTSCAMTLYKGQCLSEDIKDFWYNGFELPICKDISCSVTFNDADTKEDIVINLCDGRDNISNSICKTNASVEISQSGNAVITASSGFGESTNDTVSTGFKCIAQGGKILAKADAFTSKAIFAEIDLDEIKDRKVYSPEYISDEMNDQMPYIPKENEEEFIDKAFNLQVRALVERLDKTDIKRAVLGISGGLDSTLALLVTAAAFDKLEIDRKNITAITMPCFGTSSKTLNYALRLMKQLEATDRQIDISEAVTEHLKLIGHDMDDKNVAYENAQARERTQVLMDIANDIGAIVVGTGDMSEAALGFCTYGGDALAMYNVNAGVPKTLARLIVKHIADNSDEKLAKLLEEVLELPISPELISNGTDIAQKTEEILGPYILHDYIMYYFLCGETPTDIFEHAIIAFEGLYDSETILKTLKTFYIRFFSNQFKREANPDGPQIIDVSLSAREGFKMPSDISGKIWLEEIERL